MKALIRYGFALAVGWLGILTLAACTTSRAHPTASSTSPVLLTSYHSPTPSRTSLPSSLPTGSPPPLPTLTPTVTPTPFLHVLGKDDTLFGLALEYGVSLEAIKTANPELNPNFLTVGNSVIIPIQATSAPTSVPSATPVPVRMAAPCCYPTGDDGLWCFVLATNEQPAALENLSAWIRLSSPNGQVLREQVAIPLLNRLPSHAALPLMVFFPPPVPIEVTPSAELINSLVVPPNDTRYLTVTVQVESIDIIPDRLQADVQGSVTLPGYSLPANVVWVAAVAYNAAGEVVGARKWEAAEPLQPGGSLEFAVSVYSLGPVIAQVDIVVEARP